MLLPAAKQHNEHHREQSCKKGPFALPGPGIKDAKAPGNATKMQDLLKSELSKAGSGSSGKALEDPM